MRSSWSWPNKVVVITGASRGIGAATARQISLRGAQIGLVARGREELDGVAASLPSAAVVAPADVSDHQTLDHALATVENRFGRIDMLVNNAGLGCYRAFVETTPEELSNLWEANVAGLVHATRAVLPKMIERGDGVIVNIASIAGRIGAPYESAYSATKFAVIGLSESLRSELLDTGVHIGLVNPGPVATDFFSARGVPYGRSRPRPVAPERVAEAVIEVAERRRHERYVPRWLGAAVAVKTLVPPLYRAGSAMDMRRVAAAERKRVTAPSEGSRP